MLNTAEYKLFLENNCLICKRYKGSKEENCGTNKKIVISQYLDGVAAEAIFPLKDLKEIPQISKYSCKRFENKDNSKILLRRNEDSIKKNEKVSQLKMF